MQPQGATAMQKALVGMFAVGTAGVLFLLGIEKLAGRKGRR